MAKKTYVHPEMEIELLETVDVITTSTLSTDKNTSQGRSSNAKIQAPIDTPTEVAPSTEEVTIPDASDISETPTSEPETVIEGAGSGEMVP